MDTPDQNKIVFSKLNEFCYFYLRVDGLLQRFTTEPVNHQRKASNLDNNYGRKSRSNK